MAISGTEGTGGINSASLAALEDTVNISSANSSNGTSALTNDSSSSNAALTADGTSLDSVSTSDLAQQIQSLLSSSLNSDKVAQLKQLVSSGNYNPSGESVARSLVENLSQEIYFNQSDSTDSSTAIDGATPDTGMIAAGAGTFGSTTAASSTTGTSSVSTVDSNVLQMLSDETE